MSERPAILNTIQSEQRTVQVMLALQQLGLNPYHLDAAQAANAHQPYHNYQHCFVVALNCLAGAEAEGLDEDATRLLFLAALYHDYGHAGESNLADAFNLAAALQGMRQWLEMLEEEWVTGDDLNIIANLILSTEASHRVEPHTAAERILLDADSLATDAEDCMTWFTALSKEHGDAVTYEEHTLVRSSIRFLSTRQFFTKWGSRRRDAFLSRLQEANAWEKYLEE